MFYLKHLVVIYNTIILKHKTENIKSKTQNCYKSTAFTEVMFALWPPDNNMS